MRRVAMITAIVAIAPLSVIGVALTASSWWEGATMALGYVLSLGLLREWSLDGYPRQAIFALMFTMAAWVIGAVSAASPISFVPLSLVGALLIVRTKAWKRWIVVFALGVAAIGASSFVTHPPTGALVAAYLLTPFVGTLFIAGVVLISEQAWQVARRLDRANEAEAELAVARERVRFAGDLHDIQGHSLHVIKLKATLARRLLRTDPDRAETELDEIRRIADETITETRALTYARYQLNLVAELENAKRLYEAAGIAVEMRFQDGAVGSAHPLLAQVLREATTNVLRHARPSIVTVTASLSTVEVTNDGVIDFADSPLRGIARLRQRVEGAGGTLRTVQSADRFLIAAHIPSETLVRTERGTK